jgi:hypothetical protein
MEKPVGDANAEQKELTTVEPAFDVGARKPVCSRGFDSFSVTMALDRELPLFRPSIRLTNYV